MLNSQFSLLALSLGLASSAAAQTHKAGSFEDGGNTAVSAMMMFLGNEEKVYILDKSEGNEVKIGGFPAMGAVYDIASRQSTPMLVSTNVFCSSGMHLPNGSYATFGGNGAVTTAGAIGDTTPPDNKYTAIYDTTYGDYDGTKAIRILNPCTSADDLNSPNCQWFDNASLLSMQSQRWYSAAEPLGDGTVLIVGGFSNGGYINRNYPNVDPTYESGASNPTYEFYPANGREPQMMKFMTQTSGLNAYAHTYLMPSGKVFVQANFSTILFDAINNVETPLPDMPDKIVRVYPASGAVAMLPLTPDNGYNPTIMMCGGTVLDDYAWGDYNYPYVDVWNIPASNKCHIITPEPTDGSSPQYVEVDSMIEGRTMGQFIALPDMTMLVVNGGLNGTAGYADRTLNVLQMPFGMSLASGPVGQPAIYDPRATKGQQWSNAGFDTSSIARLYHSSAILLPDASVMIAGSNPNVDVNLTTVFPTQYKAEIFYPSYFSAPTRPTFTGAPKTLTYGGDAFDLTVPASAYSGPANDAADNTTVVLIRPGWTTHGMNMGQRIMQLANSYTVNNDGSITLHVAQLPPNPNLFQPGPALLFVNIKGIPSNGSYLIIGTGNIGEQPTKAVTVLPSSVRLDGASGSGSGQSRSGDKDNGAASTSHTGIIVGGIIAAIAAVSILGAVFGIYVRRKRRAAAHQASQLNYPMRSAPGGAVAVSGLRAGAGLRSSDSSAFVPLQGNGSTTSGWGPNSSAVNLTSPNTPYYDDRPSTDFDPYQSAQRMNLNEQRRY